MNCADRLAFLNLFKVYQESEDSRRFGFKRSLLFYLLFLAAIAYVFATTLVQAASTTDTYMKPSLSIYISISSASPSCPCSNSDGSFVFDASMKMNATANWTVYQLSAPSNMCSMVSLVFALCFADNYIPSLCPLDSFSLAEWSALSSIHQICITMATAQDTLLSNAQSSTLQLGSLISPAALSSQIGNVLRTQLQLLGLAWAQLVFTSNSVASLSSQGVFGRTFSSMNLTQETASSLSGALNTNLRFNFIRQGYTIDDALSASVSSMFVPLTNFRPVNFSALAPDLFSLNYEAYFTSCAPLNAT